MNKDLLMLYPCCFITNGYLRDVIIDTQRMKYFFVPKNVTCFLNSNVNLPLEIRISKLDKGQKTIVKKFIKILLENDVVFFNSIDLYESFTHIEYEFSTPSKINNVILDFDDFDYLNIDLVLEFNQLLVEAVQLRYFGCNAVPLLKKHLSLLDKSTIRHVDIIIPYQKILIEYYKIYVKNMIGCLLFLFLILHIIN